MSRSPFISVIVPAYNSQNTIVETLDSILAQTYTDLEIIVVDDGSPDDVASFVANKYPQVRLIRQDNRGLAGARNTGLREAQGEYVAFLDSDDVWLPEKLEMQVRQIKEYPVADVHYSDCYFWREGKQDGTWSGLHLHKDGEIARELITREVMLPVLTVVARREAILSVGGFDESLREVEDYDLWLRLALVGGFFKYLDHPTALYRLSETQMSGDLLKMARAQLRVYEKIALMEMSSGYKRELRKQIKIFKLEIFHQLRRKSAASGNRVQVAWETLRMIRVAPDRTHRLLVAGLLGFLRPRKYI